VGYANVFDPRDCFIIVPHYFTVVVINMFRFTQIKKIAANHDTVSQFILVVIPGETQNPEKMTKLNRSESRLSPRIVGLCRDGYVCE
jgi:hypothetical protein